MDMLRDTDLYRRVLESAYDGIYVTDLSRKILYWNRGAERLTGFTAEEVVGRSCSDNILVHVDGQEKSIVLTRTMGELENELSGEGFIRIHKGYLVNYRYIQVIDAGDVRLTTGELLPISRRKEHEVRDRFLELVQNNDRMVF